MWTESNLAVNKFRFLLGENIFVRDKFEHVTPSLTQDNDGCASNGYYTAIPWKDMATIAVFPSYKFRKFDAGVKMIKGHKG
jgi:hypothetical protein